MLKSLMLFTFLLLCMQLHANEELYIESKNKLYGLILMAIPQLAEQFTDLFMLRIHQIDGEDLENFRSNSNLLELTYTLISGAYMLTAIHFRIGYSGVLITLK